MAITSPKYQNNPGGVILEDPDTIFSPNSKVTPKQLVNHFYGFGSLAMDKVTSPINKNKLTCNPSSGKFE